MNQLVNEMKANSVGDITQYLTFQSGNDTFAIGILDVKEIIEIEGITRVPMMPDFCAVLLIYEVRSFLLLICPKG